MNSQKKKIKNQLKRTVAFQQQELNLQKETSLPNQLKSNLETLSGYALDDVRVHYNSLKPAYFNTHAYAQGNTIYLGPGQEKYLAHEAWHVVQQKQGRVKPTLQLKDEVYGNNDALLEKEADVMGTLALQMKVGEVKKSQMLIRKENASIIIQAKVILMDDRVMLHKDFDTVFPSEKNNDQVKTLYNAWNDSTVIYEFNKEKRRCVENVFVETAKSLVTFDESSASLFCKDNLIFITKNKGQKPTLYFKNNRGEVGRLVREHEEGPEICFLNKETKWVFFNDIDNFYSALYDFYQKKMFKNSTERKEGSYFLEFIELAKPLNRVGDHVSFKIEEYTDEVIQSIVNEILGYKEYIDLDKKVIRKSIENQKRCLKYTLESIVDPEVLILNEFSQEVSRVKNIFENIGDIIDKLNIDNFDQDIFLFYKRFEDLNFDKYLSYKENRIFFLNSFTEKVNLITKNNFSETQEELLGFEIQKVKDEVIKCKEEEMKLNVKISQLENSTSKDQVSECLFLLGKLSEVQNELEMKLEKLELKKDSCDGKRNLRLKLKKLIIEEELKEINNTIEELGPLSFEGKDTELLRLRVLASQMEMRLKFNEWK
jgi:hypothetical protein